MGKSHMNRRYSRDPVMYWGKSVGGSRLDKGIFYRMVNDYVDNRVVKTNAEKLYERFNNLQNFVKYAIQTVQNGGAEPEIMEMRNSNREKFIPYEKASVIVKDIKQILNQIGGRQGRNCVAGDICTTIDGVEQSDVVENMVDVLVGNKELYRKRIENYNEYKSTDDENKKAELKMNMGWIEHAPLVPFFGAFLPSIGISGLNTFREVPVLREIYDFTVLGMLLLTNFLLASLILNLKILKIPSAIVRFFTGTSDSVTVGEDWSFLQDEDDNSFRKFVIELVGLEDEKPFDHAMELQVLLFRGRKYLFDQKTNAVFAYANFKVGDLEQKRVKQEREDRARSLSKLDDKVFGGWRLIAKNSNSIEEDNFVFKNEKTNEELSPDELKARITEDTDGETPGISPSSTKPASGGSADVTDESEGDNINDDDDEKDDSKISIKQVFIQNEEDKYEPVEKVDNIDEAIIKLKEKINNDILQKKKEQIQELNKKNIADIEKKNRIAQKKLAKIIKRQNKRLNKRLKTQTSSLKSSIKKLNKIHVKQQQKEDKLKRRQ